MTRSTLALLMLTAVLVTGCTTTSFVSIPPVPGSTARYDPNEDIVVMAETIALKHVFQKWPNDGAYELQLPVSTDRRIYDEVAEQMPAGLTTAEAYGAPLPIYRVAQITIGRTFGTVDVLRLEGDQPRMYTVELSSDMDGWYAKRSRTWRVPVDQALQFSQERTFYWEQPEREGQEVERGYRTE